MAQSNSINVYSYDLGIDDDQPCQSCEKLSSKISDLLLYIHDLHDGFKTTDHIICLNFTCIDARRTVGYGSDR